MAANNSPFSISLPQGLIDKINDAAEAQKRSKSMIVLIALEEYFSANGGESKTLNRTPK